MNILFVCLGNICRSCTAEEIMHQQIVKAGLQREISVDSAGTSGYHNGELPDERMRTHARRHGYELTHRSRKVQSDDFYRFDLIVAMDDSNVDRLKTIAPNVESLSKIVRMTDYSQNIVADHVPDPYYGGAEGFEEVIRILEDACEGLLKSIR